LLLFVSFFAVGLMSTPSSLLVCYVASLTGWCLPSFGSCSDGWLAGVVWCFVFDMVLFVLLSLWLVLFIRPR
jgi:hypothetical protein